MSKKHYAMIAGVLAQLDISIRPEIVNMFAVVFYENSKYFNRAKFRKACGLD